MVGLSSRKPSSSSAIKRKALEAHLWPRWNFSSQLKQRSCSRCKANSSRDNHLIGREGSVFEGVGSKGEEDDARENEGGDNVLEDGIGAGLLRKERQLSRTFSS